MSDHAFDLSRFVLAQDADQTYARALSELRRGRKVSHWMWFVFPQLAGLGRSVAARHFALTSLAEARAFMEHPVLGARLVESTKAALMHVDAAADQVFGALDAVKFRSSLTLFAKADPDEPVFPEALNVFFDGRSDPATEALLARP